MRLPSPIVPFFQTVFNFEQNNRRRLETGLLRYQLLVQVISLKLSVFGLQSCLEIQVFGGVCQEGVHPSANAALSEGKANPSLEVL